MDTAYYFSSLQQEKSHAGEDEKLNINFMWPKYVSEVLPPVKFPYNALGPSPNPPRRVM